MLRALLGHGAAPARGVRLAQFHLDETQGLDPTVVAQDGDGIADIYDPDIDGDNITNDLDKFPEDPGEWRDFDGDGIGDNADTDDDNDGYPDTEDKFPNDPYEWSDLDGDGIGDNKDSDIDGDGWSNDLEKSTGSNPWDKNSVPKDMDGDGQPDTFDPDIDGDGVLNEQDEFPRDPSEWKDRDGDGQGDNSDPDDDNDGVDDTEDEYPHNPNEWKDSDGDGTGDNADTDSDNDGYPDVNDDFPNDPEEWKDSRRGECHPPYRCGPFRSPSHPTQNYPERDPDPGRTIEDLCNRFDRPSHYRTAGHGCDSRLCRRRDTNTCTYPPHPELPEFEMHLHPPGHLHQEHFGTNTLRVEYSR